MSEAGNFNIIAGIAVGMESTFAPVLVIATALIASYTLGASSGLPARTAVRLF